MPEGNLNDLQNLNNTDDKPSVRCSECDRVMEHYVTLTSAINAEREICWQCLGREEKGFFTKRGWRREARGGYIPR